MDKILEEFEEWWMIQSVGNESILLSAAKQLAWDAWQASRQALVVEIPDMPYYEFSIYALQDALNDAGVRYVWVESESD